VDKDWEARFRPTEFKFSFQTLFVISIAVAVANAILGALQFDQRSWILSIWLTVFWLVLLVVALVKFKKRGLWFLVGTPFALFFPFLVLTLLWACGHNRFACP
jgi:hypothetical protein